MKVKMTTYLNSRNLMIKDKSFIALTIVTFTFAKSLNPPIKQKTFNFNIENVSYKTWGKKTNVLVLSYECLPLTYNIKLVTCSMEEQNEG